MSGDARAGRGPTTTGFVVILGLMAAGGGATWTLLGSDEGPTEGSAVVVTEAVSPPRVRKVLPFDLSARALPARTDAGLPLVLLLEARDRATGAPVTTATLPPGLVLKGVPDLVQALELGGVATPGPDGPELLAGASFDGKGALALPLLAERAVEGWLSLEYDGATVAQVQLAWGAPPTGVVLLLPGQRLERGQVVGQPEAQRVGASFEVRIVPVRDGAPAEFACQRALRATIDGGAETNVAIRGEAAVQVQAGSTTEAARVVVDGLPGGRVESASFVVVERRS